MGSATSQALGAARQAVKSASSPLLTTAESVLATGRVIGDSAGLLAALTAFEADSAGATALVERLFAPKLSPEALSLVTALVRSRWSESSDLLVGIEEVGFRLAARAVAPAEIDQELVAIARVIAGDHELELALSNKLSPAAAKVAVLQRLFSGKVSAAALVIVEHLVRQPRARRIGDMLDHAAQITADESGYLLATVTVAEPLGEKALTKLTTALTQRYRRAVRINALIDASVVGGMKVRVADDVIDGTVAARLSELRLKLAG